MQDEFYMARALKLAQRGRFTTHPNPNVGCVIVNNGDIVGEGYHHRAGEPHARPMRCGWRAQKPKAQPPMSRLNPVAIMGERRHVAMR